VFLGSWRSTLIVLISMPLSILTSIAVLSAVLSALGVSRDSPAASFPESFAHGQFARRQHAHAACLQKAHISEDDGAQVQIAMGLQPGQDIIVSPPAGLGDGAKVKPAQQKPIREAER
jgi:hypothetical protein